MTATIIQPTSGTITIPSTTGTLALLSDVTGTGKVIQIVNYQTGAVATGTTPVPQDDTIPQNTEGTEFMTLAITPTSASNKLLIDVVINISGNTNNSVITALFQDSTANALAAAMTALTSNGLLQVPCKFSHYMTAGTTSSTTFKVRAGINGSGTTTFNGQSSARLFGGVLASSITITEIAV